MMGKYLKESLHWLQLALFKPVTLEAQAHELSKARTLRVYLKTLPVQVMIILCAAVLGSLGYELTGHPIHWSTTIIGLTVVELYGGCAFVVANNKRGRKGEALILGLGIGLNTGLGIVLGGGNFRGRAGGLGFGLMVGLLAAGMPSGVQRRLATGIFFGLFALYGLAGAFTESASEVLSFSVLYGLTFLIAYFRPFHLVPHVFQLWRSKKAADPFPFFQNSPVYWDETIAMPLPFLSDWLVRLASLNRKRGVSEIVKVARLPYQRRAAQRALVRILVQDLQQADSFEKMAFAWRPFGILPTADPEYPEHLPAGLNDAVRHIRKVSELASDYHTRLTPVGQMDVLTDLRAAAESFRDSMVLIKRPVGPAFQSAASRWLEIVNAEEAECRKRIAFEPIPNPFVVGNPLMVRDHKLFKGRKDIIVAIEENIINPAQRPALLLYGRRRIGKTSTLLNLPRLLSSKFVPVFIDCQDAKWREGDEVFCYHLAASIHDALNQRALVEATRRPQLEGFERYAFTRLGEYLDQIEGSSRTAHKQILLTFDEYEKLEEGISASKITTEVLNQLRTIVQHRERIVVLFSGSHRFEEMKTINWSDYLINVKTLELSFLAPEDAHELITEPVPLLQYEPGVIEQIIEMTHCQPYLLQGVASDLVNYLNSERRMLATAADLKVAVEKVLVTAQAYFFYTWTADCSEGEREVLRMIAIGDTNRRALAERQVSLQSLCHKDILERRESGYRFGIELFRRWVLKNQTARPLTPGDLPEPAELEYADLLTSHT